MGDPGDDGISPWAREQERALRAEVTAARAEIERVDRLGGSEAERRERVTAAAAELAAARTRRQRRGDELAAVEGWTARRVGHLVTGRHRRTLTRRREELAEAEAEEAVARGVLDGARAAVDEVAAADVTTARGLAEQRLARALDAVADRIVALEADGAGEIAELRRRTARDQAETRTVRSAQAQAGSSQVTLRWISGQLGRAATREGRRRRTLSDVLVDAETSTVENSVREATGQPVVDLDAVAAGSAQVEGELARLAEATLRIGLEGARGTGPSVAFAAPRASDVDALRAAQERADAAQRWVEAVEARLRARVRSAEVREEQARQRIRAIVTDHLGEA